ncbi:LPD25 domain-containing protein [Roseibium alexandrii]|uniref:LPD25 domain-containing protein n=1 Tax=Roseibium alexandrii TaxID=388408 RepID=UPI003753BA3D
MSDTSKKAHVSKVFVHWSESPEFSDNTEYTFSEFESLAYRVAKNYRHGGYLKTKVSVYFDNGFSYEQVRIDLADHDECGFRDHMEKVIAYAATERGQEFHRTIDAINGNDEGTSAAFYECFFDRFELANA